MRAFVSLPVPEDLAERLETLAALRFGRAVPAENMHVTLAFLDDQPEASLQALHEVLEAQVLRAPQIAVTGLDVFGGDKPRSLIAAIAPDEVLTELRKKVRQAARSAGIALSHERFRPHITLRRFQRLSPEERDGLERLLAAQGGFTWPAFRPAEVEMVQSTLTQGGAVYDTLVRYPLAP